MITPTTRRTFLSGLAALIPGAALASQPDACAQATVDGRTDAQALKKELRIDASVHPADRLHRLELVTPHLDVQEWEGHGLQAFHAQGQRRVHLPKGATHHDIVRYVALATTLPPQSGHSEVPFGERWARRQAYGKAFSREFLG